MCFIRWTTHKDVIKINDLKLLSKRSQNVMTHINVLRALDKPNGMASPSYSHSHILSDVFHSSLGHIQIWWYTLFKSIFENTLALVIWSNISSSLRIENLYLTTIIFITLLSIHMSQVPSFFGTSKAGTAQGLLLS